MVVRAAWGSCRVSGKAPAGGRWWSRHGLGGCLFRTEHISMAAQLPTQMTELVVIHGWDQPAKLSLGMTHEVFERRETGGVKLLVEARRQIKPVDVVAWLERPDHRVATIEGVSDVPVAFAAQFHRARDDFLLCGLQLAPEIPVGSCVLGADDELAPAHEQDGKVVAVRRLRIAKPVQAVALFVLLLHCFGLFIKHTFLQVRSAGATVAQDLVRYDPNLIIIAHLSIKVNVMTPVMLAMDAYFRRLRLISTSVACMRPIRIVRGRYQGRCGITRHRIP
jgi:hypothetical protein